MDFANEYNTELPLLLGEISELYSSPVIPKILIVGLSDLMIEKEPNLRIFKDILSRALDNLFVIDFAEQFIPTNVKIPSNQVHYRNHEVKEMWMYRIRAERPAVLIDFRLVSLYSSDFGDDDSMLIDHILETKNSLPIDGPVYLVWLAGRNNIPQSRLSVIMKNCKLDKSSLSMIELLDDPIMLSANLKSKIQECFEHCRYFYQNQMKKYKKLVTKTDQNKFIQPWMAQVYYYFKMAVLEEFRGDFASALKYYHTILAKFKELIENLRENVDQRYQMINYLRKFSDICFMRLSFLLFRMDQSGEAEFGLFRYLNYFSHGLNHAEQLLWRYNMARGFARQLGNTVKIWPTEKTNDKLMRGPSHFLIYALEKGKRYLKMSTDDNVYQIQEMIMRDLAEAMEYSVNNPNLGYFVDFLQLCIIDEYFKQLLEEESRAFLNYLKESPKIKGWSLLEDDVLKKSSSLSLKFEQNYQNAVLDEWRRGKIEDINSFEDWCLMHAQINQQPIRLSSPRNFIFCNVRFQRKQCEILEECQIELNVYVSHKSPIELQVESIGIFFDNEQIDPITFICDDVFEPGKVKKFYGSFLPMKLGMGKIKISFVTMQLKRPFLALQFDEFSFLHQQNYERILGRNESLDFMRLCHGTRRSALQIKLDPLKPKVSVEILLDSEAALLHSEISISLIIKNLTDHPTNCELMTNGKEFDLGPHETQTFSLKHKITENGPITAKIKLKFNLELMDFRFTDVCNFDPVEEEFRSKSIEAINPFKIEYFTKKNILVVSAYRDIEWVSVNQMAHNYIIKEGEKMKFKLETEQTSSIEGSFRLLNDPQKIIYRKEWNL